MTTGSFDKPESIPLDTQVGMEGRLPQIEILADLPDFGTTEDDMADEVAGISASNNQHPDHDTDDWPVR